MIPPARRGPVVACEKVRHARPPAARQHVAQEAVEYGRVRERKQRAQVGRGLVHAALDVHVHARGRREEGVGVAELGQLARECELGERERVLLPHVEESDDAGL